MHFQSYEQLFEFMDVMFAPGKIVWIHFGDQEFLAEAIEYDMEQLLLKVRLDTGKVWNYSLKFLQASQSSLAEAAEFRSKLAKVDSETTPD